MNYSSEQHMKDFMTQNPISTSTKNTVDNWADFFGQPQENGKHLYDPEAFRSTQTPNLAAALENRSKLISNIVQQLVLTRQNWYLLVMPAELTDDLNFLWTSLTYNAILPSATPSKTPSRLLSHRSTSHTGRLERQGLALEVEIGHLSTPQGQQHFAYSLNQMVNGVTQFLYISVIRAYLSTGDYDAGWQRVNGKMSSMDITKQIEREIQYFAITQKEELALQKMNNYVTNAMLAYGGQANFWILPPNVPTYESLVPAHSTDYYLSGMEGPLRAEDSAVPKAKVGESNIYICAMTDGDGDAKKNLLSAQAEIGSYNTMIERPSSGLNYFEEYKSGFRSISVYHEDFDSHITLTMEDGLKGSTVFNRRTGLVEMPKNIPRTAGGSGIEHDMFSYTSPLDGKRYPARIFGHLDRKNFGFKDIDNLVQTIKNYHGKKMCDDICDSAMALKKGIQLVGKINATPVKQEWFFNVFCEHLISSGVDVQKLAGVWEDPEAINEYVLKVTKQASRRSNTSVRIIKGTGGEFLPLPAKNYFAAMKAVKTEGSLSAVAQLPPRQDVPLGGSTPGALAGYGSWDGMLALAAEYKNGSASAQQAYTKNGYLVKDCATAAAFVEAVESITETLNSIFHGSAYLNPQKAELWIDSPTSEHAICGRILNMTGFPVYLDVSKGNVLGNPAEGSGFKKDLLIGKGYQEYAQNYMNGEDSQNATKYSHLSRWVGNLKNVKLSKKLMKLLNFYFEPTSFSNIIDVGSFDKNYSAVRDSEVVVAGSLFFPLANTTPLTITRTSSFLRSVALELLYNKIVGNKQLDENQKADLIEGVLETIGIKTGLGNYAMTVDERARKQVVGAGAQDQFARILTNASLSFETVPTLVSPLDFDALIDIFNSASVENFVDRSFMEWVRQKNVEYNTQVELDLEDSRQNPNWAPVVFMTGTSRYLERTRNASLSAFEENSIAEIEKALADSSGKKPTAEGYYVGGIYDDQDVDENFWKEAQRESPYKLNFFRTPLTLSSNQVVESGDILKSEGRATAMNMRVAYPSAPETYVEGSRVDALIEKIRNINKRVESTISSSYSRESSSLAEIFEHPAFFYQKNAAARNKLIAASGSFDMSGFAPSFVKADGTSLSQEDQYPIQRQQKWNGPTFDDEDEDILMGNYSGGGEKVSLARKRQRETDPAYAASYGSASKRRKVSDQLRQLQGEGPGYYGRGTTSGYGLGTPSTYLDDDEGNEFGYSRERGEVLERVGFSMYPGGSGSSSTPQQQSSYYDADYLNEMEKDKELTPNVVEILLYLSQSVDLLAKIFGYVYATSTLDLPTLFGFYDKNIVIPFNFLIFRPHQRYVTYYAIKALAGKETASVKMAYPNFIMQPDAQVKTVYGHLTFHHGAFVYQPGNVFTVPHAYVGGRLGGAGFSPIDPERYNPSMGEKVGDAMYVIVPYTETIFPDYMSVTGRWSSLPGPNFLDPENLVSFHYSQFWRFMMTYGHKLMDNENADMLGGLKDGKLGNTVVIAAQQKNYSLVTRNFTDFITNKGHFGEEDIGSKLSREGKLKPMAPQNKFRR